MECLIRADVVPVFLPSSRQFHGKLLAIAYWAHMVAWLPISGKLNRTAIFHQGRAVRFGKLDSSYFPAPLLCRTLTSPAMKVASRRIRRSAAL
jgi:hypothetical protein